MTKYRIGYTAALMICVLAYIFLDSFAGLYLGAGLLVLLAVSVLVTLLNRRGPEAEIMLPGSCRKNQQITGKLILRKNSGYLIFKVQVELEIKNLLTGEVLTQDIMTSVSGKKATSVEFGMKSPLCGCIQARIRTVTVYDLLGVCRKTFRPDVMEEMLVLPDTFVTEINMMQGMLSDNESIEYSNDKPGEDISEIFGIREYLPGDSIKNIHWKLTSKYDELMVRLPSLPLENSVLLMMETSAGDNGGAAVYDAMAEIYITFSQTLLQNDIAHEIAWYDHQNEILRSFDIEQEDDLLGTMGKVLSASHSQDDTKAYQHYIQEHGEIGKAHLIYIAQEYDVGIRDLSDEIRKTTVVCSNIAAETGGEMVYYCTPDDYMQQLHYINI